MTILLPFTGSFLTFTDYSFLQLIEWDTFRTDNLKGKEIKMEEYKNNKRAIIGILLICAGLLLIAVNFNWLPWNIRGIVFSWQGLLILIGLFLLISRENRLAGFILIGVGAFFMIPHVLDIPFNWHRLFWPVVLVAIGFLLITRRWGHQRIPVENSIEFIDDSSIFGGGDKVITTQNFRGGRITSIFGGSKIDFRTANLAKGRNVIDIFAMFGGTKLIIPTNWDVKIEVSSIFGGFSDKRRPRPDEVRDPSRELVIKGVTIFGGGDIEGF
jgi:predicted membrane protein